jgi:hypothetical protein
MADVKLYFTFRHLVEDSKKGHAAESSVGELYTWERLLPIMLSTTFLFLVVFLVGLGIMLWAYRTLDSETSFRSCQST